MVPVQLGKAACQRLSDMGYAVDYSEYPMEHAVCPDEIAEISRWLQEVLSSR
jgi:phospholipase/carboxylesterase